MPAQNKAVEAKTMEKPESKISLVVAIYVGLGLVVLDIIDLIPFAGDFTNIPRLGINFYLYSIGVSGVIFLAGEALKFIPFVQWLPTDLVAWAATVLFEWFAPAGAKKAAEQAGAAMQGGAGAEAGAGAEGAAAAQQEAESAGAQGTSAAENAAQEGEAGASAEEGGATEGERQTQEEGGEGEAGEEGEEDNGEGKDSELEREMETGAERSPEDEADERDFDLPNSDDQSDSEDDEEDEENKRVEQEAAHNRAVQSGKVVEMPLPQKGRSAQPAAPEVPFPTIDEVPRPNKKAA